MKVFAICVIAASIAAVTAVPHVEEQVYKDLAKNGRITAILHFKGPSNAEVREKFRAEYHATGKAFDHDTLPDLLTANANKHQAKTLEFLKSRQLAKGAGPNFLQLWMLNQLAVHEMDLELLNELKKSDEVTYIEANREYQLLNNVQVNEASSTDGPHILNTDGPHILQNEVQWGVSDVGAPEVWQQGFTGQGIVVGIIDTGVRESHEILRDNYRQEKGWLDATIPFLSFLRSRRPYDDQGHGSHCTGSIVGKMGYGVAPDAKWIACKALRATGSGDSVALRECGQFMACPTDFNGRNRDCSKRPNIISNSWGSESSTRFYDDIIKTWIDNGQIPVFANGNAGDKCSSTGSPADYVPAISVGATNSSNKVAKFSSRGPTKDGQRKPDVSAPGQNIKSASFLTDSSYQTLSGTSMATPHVAGIAALYMSKNPNLSVNKMRELLEQSSIPTEATGQTCGDISDDVYPNNAVGYGKVYAPKGISMI